MFRASLCSSSGAHQLPQQPLIYRRKVVVAVLLVVVGPAVCREKKPRPNYINTRSNGNSRQCNNTIKAAVRFRINQHTTEATTTNSTATTTFLR
jgi:hypothetical protein